MQEFYEVVADNVHRLKLIQIGLTFSDYQGNLAYPCSSWQFNLKFDHDCYIERGAEELLKKAGINFDILHFKGIRHVDFSYYFLTSGILMNPKVTWVAFHSNYDFAYLFHLIVGGALPARYEDFETAVFKMFPTIYDLKWIMRKSTNWTWSGGLDKLSAAYELSRSGAAHQAGSDSLMTAEVFFNVVKSELGVVIEDSPLLSEQLLSYKNVVYGFGHDPSY